VNRFCVFLDLFKFEFFVAFASQWFLKYLTNNTNRPKNLFCKRKKGSPTRQYHHRMMTGWIKKRLRGCKYPSLTQDQGKCVQMAAFQLKYNMNLLPLFCILLLNQSFLMCYGEIIISKYCFKKIYFSFCQFNNIHKSIFRVSMRLFLTGIRVEM